MKLTFTGELTQLNAAKAEVASRKNILNGHLHEVYAQKKNERTSSL